MGVRIVVSLKCFGKLLCSMDILCNGVEILERW
jgi:hypothetical protein